MTSPASIYDITIVGHVTHDTIIRGTTVSSRPGGVPYYAGISACALGATVRIITRVAPEDEGLLDEMRSAGAVVDNYASDVTTRFTNQYEGDDEQRTQQVEAVADSIRPEHVTGHSRLWLFGPLLPDDIPPECLGRPTGSNVIALDVQGLARIVTEREVKANWSEKAALMLSSAHIVKFGDEELRAAIGDRNDGSLLELPGAKGCEIIATYGARGSRVFVGGVSHDVAAVKPRRIADTTGCGDTYFAAYLWRRLCGDAPPSTARFGAAAAALKAETAGPLRADEQTIRQFARLGETTEVSGGKGRV